jgi:hopanoid biosynthesis associated radical SAM protein HpnJ
MKTLFLNPPSYDDFDGGAGSRYQARREVWSFWYPTWLCYPAGLLPESRVLDAPPEQLTQEATVAVATDYDLVVLHTSTPSFRLDVRTAEMIKAANPDCVIGFVGGHVTAQPGPALAASPGIDFVARKEFDLSVKEVWEGRDWGEIAGISYRRDGAIHHNPERAPLTNDELDRLPFVTQIYNRDLQYLKYNSPYCHYPYVSLYTGRGCPARCTFCLWPQVTTGHSYRVRSPENVLQEVREMPRLFPQMKEIFFDDDTFTADPARARRIAELLRPLGLCWSTNSRANVDRDTLKVLKDGGLRLFVIGYESGNDQVLKNIRKGVSIERARRFTRDCHDIGILIHGTFIIGLPGETKETIEETIRFAREMNPETVQVSLASPYPGTHFYRYVQDNGFLVESVYNDEAGYQKCTVTYPGLSAEEMFDAVERFYRKYYFRPTYVFKSLKKMAKSRDERKRLWREGMEFFSSMRKRRTGTASAAAH